MQASAASSSVAPAAISCAAVTRTRVDGGSKWNASSAVRIAVAHCTSRCADGRCDARLGDDHLGLAVGRQIAHRQRDEPLPEGRLELLERAAVGRVVGAHQHEGLRRLDDLAGPVEIEGATVVGQRMQDGQRVVACLDDLVEIADGAGLYGPGERAVGPHHVAAGHHESADEIRAGQIVVAADGHDRPSQQDAHVLDEPGLAASCRAGEHHR